MLMFRTREMSRMPLPFVESFSMSCLVWGLAPLFVYCVWKVLLHELHLQRGFPFACLPIFTTSLLSQCMHLTSILTTLIASVGDQIFTTNLINYFDT